MNRAFWSNRRVLVTGHTGFKGGWLTLWLQALGAQVSGYALPPPTRPSLFETARINQGINSMIGDLRDLQQLQSAVDATNPEIVFHLAAQSLVRKAYSDPVGTYGTNIMGTVHLLEAVRSLREVRAIVVVTSDKCYENREWVWGYREDEAMGGFDPYSSSKGCAELVTAAYRNSYYPLSRHSEHRVGIATARSGNVIGGGDWAADRLIPDCIRALDAGVPIRIRSPDAVRPWQHVLDPLAGYLMLAERLCDDGASFAEAWNFGPSDDGARPVRFVVDHLIRGWNGAASWELDATARPHEANYLKLDCSKARARLQWHPKWPLPIAIDKTAAWYRAHETNGDMRASTLAQINEYQSTDE